MCQKENIATTFSFSFCEFSPNPLSYLVDTITSATLDSIVCLSSSLDLVQSCLGVDRLLVQDVDTADIVGLAGLKLLGRILSNHIIELEGHAFPTVVNPCTSRPRRGGSG